MHFDHGKNEIEIFNFLAFPIGYIGGLRWRWGLKTNIKKKKKRFDYGEFEIKTFPIYAPPYCVT